MSLLFAGAARANEGADMIGAMAGICITSLESGAAVGPGLKRADPAMEAKLLNGKTGTVWRTWNAQIVIVAHDSGDTCEVMGIGMLPGGFARALNGWREDAGRSYAIDAGQNMPDDGPGGAYLARQMPERDFIQMFIQTQPEARFIGITVARVKDSTQAREVLGL